MFSFDDSLIMLLHNYNNIEKTRHIFIMLTKGLHVQ